MRWAVLALFALGLGAGCTPPDDIRYTAAYEGLPSSSVVMYAVEAAVGQGYQIAATKNFGSSYVFVTYPVRLAPADRVDVAYKVQITYEQKTRTKSDFTIFVIPAPFLDHAPVSSDRLPPDGRPRGEALSAAIRARLRSYEAPM